MISDKALKDILQEPLGPYHDRDVLHETKCQMHGGCKLVLYSFTLEHNGHVTGLDESEHPVEGHDHRTFRFRGVLTIANPDWLSAFGLKTVEAELNLRAKECGMREGARRVPLLTLEELFGRGRLIASNDAHRGKEGEIRLMVLVQGKKKLPAVFMRSERAPDGLLWSSIAHNRNYQIATMDVESYSKSENFFWRWRLLALMEKIISLYPFDPPRIRTPIWFVERYLKQLACPPGDRDRRLLFDDDDTDVDEHGKTKTPRHLLRPHRSEILGLFAAQADWLITNNEVRRQKLFDIGSWEIFAEEARNARREAARQGVTWGCPVGHEAEEEEEEGSSQEEHESDEDELSRLVRKNPVIGKSNKTVVRKIELARAKSKREIKRVVSSDSESEVDAPGHAEYASDFSEPSDAEEYDSDHRLEEEEAMDRIPWQLQLPPLPPDVDGRWWCPLRGCNHRIDLYNLAEGEKRAASEDIVGYILQKQWRNAAYDKKVLRGFGNMVANHYMKHFEEQGVRVEKREGRPTRFTLIDNRQRRHGGGEPQRGPMPVRGTLGGESRVVPTVHAPQAGHFRWAAPGV